MTLILAGGLQFQQLQKRSLEKLRLRQDLIKLTSCLSDTSTALLQTELQSHTLGEWGKF